MLWITSWAGADKTAVPDAIETSARLVFNSSPYFEPPVKLSNGSHKESGK